MPFGLDVVWLGSSQLVFDLGKDLLDWIEVWDAGRQEEHVRALGADEGVQRNAFASEPMVLRKNADANLP